MLVEVMVKNFKNTKDFENAFYYAPYIPLTYVRGTMTSPEECFHPELTFGSGDYYIFCNRCGRKWATMGNYPEHGHDSHGHPIGADPSQANKLKNYKYLQRDRVLIDHE